MTSCITCELTRAKARVFLLLLVGKTLQDIANDLSELYGAEYFVLQYGTAAELRRVNTVPPHEPYVVYSKE